MWTYLRNHTRYLNAIQKLLVSSDCILIKIRCKNMRYKSMLSKFSPSHLFHWKYKYLNNSDLRAWNKLKFSSTDSLLQNSDSFANKFWYYVNKSNVFHFRYNRNTENKQIYFFRASNLNNNTRYLKCIVAETQY